MTRHRPGIALFSALALLALSGILIAGALASSVMVARSGKFAQTDAELTMAAEYAIATVVGDASRYDLARLAFSATATIDVVPPNGPRVSVAVTRLTHDRLWLVATASRDVDDARRRLNVIARFDSPLLLTDAPFVSAGGVELSTGVQFGADIVGDRDCTALSVADLIVSPSAVVRGATSERVERRPIADDLSTYLDGPIWAGLIGRSGVTYAPADLTLTGVAPSTVVLVAGRLTIIGPFTFSGLIVARGGIEVRGAGSSVTGVVFSASRDSNAVKLTGVLLRFSRCAAMRALNAIVPIRPIRERSWIELY